MIKCIHCGAENEPIFTYCLSCGKPLEQSLSTFKPRRTPSALASLVLVRADGTEGDEYPLSPGENLVSSTQGAVTVEDDPWVADQHCLIDVGEDVAVLRDLGSKYGTFVRIKEKAVLEDGAELRIGHGYFRLELRKMVSATREDGTEPLFSVVPRKDHFGRLLRLGPDGVVMAAYVLYPPETLIGRATGDVLLPEDSFVSARHAALSWDGSQCTVRDLRSTNGVFIRVRGKLALHDGDRLLIGHHLYVFRVHRG